MQRFNPPSLQFNDYEAYETHDIQDLQMTNTFFILYSSSFSSHAHDQRVILRFIEVCDLLLLHWSVDYSTPDLRSTPRSLYQSNVASSSTDKMALPVSQFGLSGTPNDANTSPMVSSTGTSAVISKLYP